jgi:uncharacterized iron-regulated protein
MKPSRAPAALLLALWLVIGCAAGERTDRALRVYDLERGHGTTAAQILPSLKKNRIVLVGERHDAASHHRAQLEIIRLLRESGTPLAVGLEMFRRNSQEALDRWVAGELSEAAFQERFRDNWGYGWPLYRDIFLYARENGIPMVGLNVPRDITRQVAREGYDSLSPARKAELGNVTCTVDQAYMDFIRRAYGGHGHGGGGSFLHFCEAQMVWDSAMAVRALGYLERNPERTMVMLLGNGHARKQAVPAQIRSRSGLEPAVLLPEVPGRIDTGSIGVEDADYLLLGLKKP